MTPFVDVAEKSFTVETPQGQGNTTFNSVGIGTGSKVFRADSSGIWLGAAEFANAPFRVDMDGNATATSLTITGYVQEVGGTYTSASGTGARVQLLPDANTGIVGYDSTNAKVFEVVVGGTNSGDVTLGNYGAGKGIFWDDSAATLDIKGNISAGNISGVAITGSTLSTGTSGSRVQMDTGGDNIQFYNSSGVEGLRVTLESSTGGVVQSKNGRNLRLLSDSGTVQFGNANLTQLGDISTAGTISGGTISGSHTGTASFSSLSMSGAINMNNQSMNNTDRVSGSSAYLDFNSTDLRCSATFVPVSANSQNIGNSGNRWNYLNCVGINKTVGTWGYFDNGVEMQDGTILSDTEALLAMEENTEVLTPYGATSYKPESLPKVIRIIPRCEVCGEIHPKDENGKYFRWVKKKTKDDKGKEIEVDTKVYDVDEGEDVFATISIMLGAIKELAREVKSLRSQLERIEALEQEIATLKNTANPL